VKHAAIGLSSVAFPLTVLLFLAGVVAAQSARPHKDIPAIAKAANGAIVSIITSDKDGKPVAQGTGFLISRDGRIVTNYHVIENGSSAIVKLPDGAFYVVDGVLASDKARDVAVIKAHGRNFRTVTLGDSDRVQVGQPVVAIGNPLSLESTVSNGIISGIRTVEEEGGKFLQVTTPISPGSSGGPLFNMAGEVIGITTMYLKGGENLNFAIPINDAKRLLLTEFSKLQALPNEQPEEMQGQVSNGDAPSSSTPSGRGYYKQLYDAGGFSQSPPMYVCFSDKADSVGFWTIEAKAYDETYDKAFSKAVEIMSEKDWKQNPEKVKEFNKEYETYDKIQLDLPYITFVGEDGLQLLSSLGAGNLAEFLRQGGRILQMDWYSRGVKNSTQEYYWNEHSWVYKTAVHNAVYQFYIEPATMRYTLTMMDDTFAGVGPILVSGACEKIPAKQ
jgi:Trypsin-like peptidase domain